MKQTNYLLFDFLDFDPALGGEDRLWKACRPAGASQRGEAVMVRLPFQKQRLSVDMQAEPDTERREYEMTLRAYGDKILRVSVGFGEPVPDVSPMLEIAPELAVRPLEIEKNEEKWYIRDPQGRTRAVFNLREPETDHWSDLLPPPDETLDAVFYPDGNKPVEISAYDQFFPARNDALALAYVEKNGCPHRASLSFHAEPDERFAGTGERFARMDLSGRTFLLKNQDGQGVNNRRTYKNVPFFLSSRGYGMFLHTSACSKLSLADHSSRSVQILAEQPLVDIFLIGGKNPEEILFEYRRLTGFPRMPPLWSFGIWMSRMSYFSAAEVNEVADRLRAEDFPCDVIHLDTGWFKTDWLCEWQFNPERFPDPEGFIAGLKEKGYRISLWQMPYIAAEAVQYEEASGNGYIGEVPEKSVRGGSNFSALDYAGTIDFTYPRAVEWYKGLLKPLLDMGVACIKTDFGEDIHLEASYHGMDPELLNNLYALLYQQAAYEITEAIRGEGIIWARAGWAGCQRYPLHWGGDAAATWDGMAGSLKGGLHLGLSGFGFWSHDVPGFHGVPDFMNAVIPDQLYVRWTQFGVLSSHIRYHGTSKREPYHYPGIAGIVRKWWKLRYAFIPYILEQSRKATETGYPVLRALIFHHPEDRLCWHIDDQYYFGDDLLVAPVMNAANKRDVYLPEGAWMHLFTGQVYQGGCWLKELEVPLEEMPVWARYGAAVPFYPWPVSCTDEMDPDKATRVVFNESFKGIFNELEIEN